MSDKALIKSIRELEETLTGRGEQYGTAKDNVTSAAVILGQACEGLSGLFETAPISGKALILLKAQVAIKLARLKTDPEHLDSWLDIAGYATIAHSLLAGNDAE